jgi:hypothetical protein
VKQLVRLVLTVSQGIKTRGSTFCRLHGSSTHQTGYPNVSCNAADMLNFYNCLNISVDSSLGLRQNPDLVVESFEGFLAELRRKVWLYCCDWHEVVEKESEQLSIQERELLNHKKADEYEKTRDPLPFWYELRNPKFHSELVRHNKFLSDNVNPSNYP